MRFRRITASILIRKLRQQNRRGLALDIDDTLSYTDFHWIRLLMSRFPHPDRLTWQQILGKHPNVESVPHWQTAAAQATIRRFLTSNAFQRAIPLVRNANHGVNRINRLVPIVAYVTARPVGDWSGTRRWLQQHGFPDAPMIFRPARTHITRKHSWKALLLASLYPEVAGIIDDDPDLADQLRSIDYRGMLFLYDSGHNVKPYRPHHRNRYRNWGAVVRAVAKARRKLSCGPSA